MKAYTMKEVSKKIKIPPRTIRQWEKDLTGLLEIPRTKQGARIYTEIELSLLLEIKQLYFEKASRDEIRTSLQEMLMKKNEILEVEPETFLQIVPEEISPISAEETGITNPDVFFEVMDTYKQTFLNDVKEEIRSVVRKEVLDEVKKEISKGTFLTVKSLSDSIYKATENTKAEIIELAETLEKTAENTPVSLQYLSNSIANSSIEASEEFFSLSKQLSETTEELLHYVDVTNSEIDNLTETISKEREVYIEDREQFRNEISQREAAFQNFLFSFRDAAAAKEKKWWKFWA
jgi:DNA-binding transcriptional MerR regulator